MGRDIPYNNVNFPDRAAARAVCLAARGDYGGCDSARAARLGSHAARGGRGGRSSGSTMRVVVTYYISAAPRKLPHWGLISFCRRRRDTC